jgi:hypothetical protein
MIRKISIILFAVLFVGCSEENEPTIFETGVSIWVRENSSSNNLLNNENPNSFKKEDIRVYSLDANGEKKELYTPNLDAPRNFSIIAYNNKGVNENLFILYPYLGKTDKTETTTTLVEWRSGIVDTITCEIYRNKGLTTTNKIWYNNLLKYDISDKSVNNNSLEYVVKLIEVRK